MRRLFASRPLLWAALVIPGAVVLWRWIAGAASYGEVIHETGVWAARILILTLAVTPIRLLFPRTPAAAWLLRRRRDLGLASFAYAGAHTVVYLWRKKDLALIWQEGIEPGLLTGWIALAIFIPLAITSNNAAVRALGRLWKGLHRLVYLAALLVFAHWVLSAFDPLSGYIHLAVLAAIELLRIVLQQRRQRVT